jgi:hypothetical protein
MNTFGEFQRIGEIVVNFEALLQHQHRDTEETREHLIQESQGNAFRIFIGIYSLSKVGV